MKTYKAIATITWKFDSKDSREESLERAKSQFDKIIGSMPHGEEFEDFSIQMDLARMKERKKLVHISEFKLSDVFPYVSEEEFRKEYEVDDEIYLVRMNSDRYFVFKKNPYCVSCGLEGKKFMLDINPGDQSPHFNLYGEEYGRLVLMTKDHIIAKSKGGKDELSNYQTMCSTCNNLKGHYGLNLEQVEKLRFIYNNEDMLPRKELRDLINSTRDEMMLCNQRRDHERDAKKDSE